MAGRFKKRVMRNWQVKLYMLLLAVLLWLFVVLNETYETGLWIPLEIVDVRPNKVLVSDVPDVIGVRFSGKGKDLLAMRFLQQPRVVLDVHTIRRFYDYPLELAFVEVPTGVAVEPLSIMGPDTVSIRMEDEIVRRVPVRSRIAALPAPGFLVSEKVTTLPESVVVVGPESQMRSISYVETEEKSLANLSETTNIELAIMKPDSLIRITPRRVSAQVAIDRLAERKLQRVPVRVRRISANRHALLEPTTVDLYLSGPAKRLAAITADSVSVYLDLSIWSSIVRHYEPSVEVPEGIELVKVDPDRIRVRVERLEDL